MYTIDYTILFVLCLFTLVSTSFFISLVDGIEKRLIIIFPSISTFVYSGIGISFEDVNDKYLIHYFVFLITFQFCLYFLIRKANASSQLEFRMIEHLNNKFENKALKILAFIYLTTFIISLIYPVYKLNLLWNPPVSSISNLVNSKFIKVDENFILYTYIRLLLLPFFLIYLYTLLCKNRKYTALLIVLIWFYFDYVNAGYIARNQFVLKFLFLYLLFRLSKRSDNVMTINFNIKDILFLVGMMFFLIPFFLWYASFRLTGDVNMTINFDNSLKNIIDAECNYPKYYEIIEDARLYPFYKVILYVLCLPIPSFLFPMKPTLTLGDDFTGLVTGLSRGERGFSIVLPSVLGESFLLFGSHLYFFNAILIASIAGCIFQILFKSNYFLIVRMYLFLRLLLVGRGGGAAVISTFINEMLSLLLFIFLIMLKDKIMKRRKKLEY